MFYREHNAPRTKRAGVTSFKSNAIIPDAIEQFRQAIADIGITPPDTVVADGQIHRFRSSGKSNDKNGYYCLYGNGIPAGYFGCWRLNIKCNWRANVGRELTQKEFGRNQQCIEEMKLQREAETHRKHEAAANKASYIWNSSESIAEQSDHPYLVKKKIEPHGARLYKGSLVIPIYNESRQLVNLQFIDSEGKKHFLSGGRKNGCFYVIGNLSDKILICEGFATGASLHEDSGKRVVIALDAGNLLPVARNIKKLFPDSEIIICGDNDVSGVGQSKAREAALDIGGKVLIPKIPGNDWNDLVTGVREHG